MNCWIIRSNPVTFAAMGILCGLTLAAVSGCAGDAEPVADEPLSIERNSEALNLIIPLDATPEIIARGFTWAEGPVWVADGGYLLFSDVPENKIFRWTREAGLSEFLSPSGNTGARTGSEDGANGLIIGRDGSLLLAQHGDRRIASLRLPIAREHEFGTIAAEYAGGRFNSPNDLIEASDGAIYFTDPPYGFIDQDESSLKELDANGVYRVGPSGTVSLVVDTLERPNGIGLSPDERTLYVSNSQPGNELILAYDLARNGIVSNGRIFFDARPLSATGLSGLPDGMAIDTNGNLFASGPGGVQILSPAGEHLGTIVTGSATANCTFGDDGTVLYITADSNLIRLQTTTHGLGFGN